jgi:hypothetical protein
MRDVAVKTAEQLGLEIQLEEINDTEQLAASNLLIYPRLYIGDQLIASRNPRKAIEIKQQFQEIIKEPP